MSLCQRSSFSAENTPITVVPAFTSRRVPLALLSSPHQPTIGPFVAGMPLEVPLWMAKLLHQKQLAQIQVPEWMSLERLTDILKKEKKEEMLTKELPYYYYEIARSLTGVLNQSTSDGSSSSGGGKQQAAWIVLQDLVAVRVDKIRQNFHDLSRETLVQSADELPMIAVTGIASVELNKVGPFINQAFSDYAYIIQQTQTEEEGKQLDQDAQASQKTVETDKGPGARKAVVTKSRLRRFRQ